MDENKKYEVVTPVVIDNIEHSVGAVIEIAESKAAELGDAVKIVVEEVAAPEEVPAEAAAEESAPAVEAAPEVEVKVEEETAAAPSGDEQ